MSRERFILVKRPDGGGDLVPVADYHREKAESGPMVIKDCEPFLSMADGKTVITSRSQYRDHLRAHGCVEIGSGPIPAPARPEPNVAPVLKDIYHAARDGNTDALRRIAQSGKVN